jgi:flagellar motor switch protein FliN/FliY
MVDDIEEELGNIADAAGDIADATSSDIWDESGMSEKSSQTIDFLMDVTLLVTVEVGRARMTIQDLLQLSQGSVLELEKLAGEPLDIFINGKQVARGEAVIVNEKFGVRITDILSPEDRMGGLR